MAENFKELNIWKEGFDLLAIIYRLTEKYPVSEKFGLISQTRELANSIIANIAESCGRYYYADKVRVLYQSRGEVEEIRSHLTVASKLEYLTEKDYFLLDKRYEGLYKGISRYILSLRNKNS